MIKDTNRYRLLSTQDNDIESKQIELTDQSNNFENYSTHTQSCSICLEELDNSCLKLDCGCKNKFHAKCIDEIKKNKINKCPLCKNKIFKDNNNSVENNKLKLLEFVILVFFSIYLYTIIYCIISSMSLIMYPSELKYCDNHYKKCEYYQTSGILINNTIVEEFTNFDITYKLSSSFEYKLIHENTTKICNELETHYYDTYDSIVKISQKSIGMEKQIFVPYDTKKECRLTYKFYNPKRFIDNLFVVIFVCGIIMLTPSVFVLTYLSENPNSVNTNIKKILKFMSLFVLCIGHFIEFVSWCGLVYANFIM